MEPFSYLPRKAAEKISFYYFRGMLKKSFAPIVPDNSRVLILGSLPGDRSLTENQYYAHPQNRFWKTISVLFNTALPTIYSERVALLHREGVALWDVCEMAFRKGSMDTDIMQEVPNKIPELLADNPSIKAVFFNGLKAQKLYDRYFKRDPGLQYITLPSTSPANASFNQERLLEKWQPVLEVLR